MFQRLCLHFRSGNHLVKIQIGQAIFYHILKALIRFTRRQTLIDIYVQTKMKQIYADLQLMLTVRSGGIGYIHTGQVLVICPHIAVVFLTDKGVNQVFRPLHPFFLRLCLL